jgi:hypothetical protein
MVYDGYLFYLWIFEAQPHKNPSTSINHKHKNKRPMNHEPRTKNARAPFVHNDAQTKYHYNAGVI